MQLTRVHTCNLVLVFRLGFCSQFLWRLLLAHQRIRLFLGHFLYFFSLLYVILKRKNEKGVNKRRITGYKRTRLYLAKKLATHVSFLFIFSPDKDFSIKEAPKNRNLLNSLFNIPEVWNIVRKSFSFILLFHEDFLINKIHKSCTFMYRFKFLEAFKRDSTCEQRNWENRVK